MEVCLELGTCIVSSDTQPPGSMVKALVATPATATATVPGTGRVIRRVAAP
jgi:hypothetical protein